MSKIRYQLPNGKYVYLTFDQILDMDLEMLQDLMADDTGFDSENPWDDQYDGYADPQVWEVPQVESEDIKIPDFEKDQIKKDCEDGD